MKKYLFSIFLILLFEIPVKSQISDNLLSKCTAIAGADAQYLKDFRIQLGSAVSDGDPRYKVQMSLMKNIKYRFSMCNTDDSKGKLIVNLKDDTKKLVLTSYDPKTGKSYTSVDFICSKTGLYEVCYDFTNRQQGSGIGIISFVK